MTLRKIPDHCVHTQNKVNKRLAKPEATSVLLFASDQSLAHENEEKMRERITNLNLFCEKCDMTVSISKTEGDHFNSFLT